MYIQLCVSMHRIYMYSHLVRIQYKKPFHNFTFSYLHALHGCMHKYKASQWFEASLFEIKNA